MALLNRLLSRTLESSDPLRAKVVVRVWLGDDGRIRDLKVLRSCGDPHKDAVAVEAIALMQFPRGALGSRTSQRWHDLSYEVT
jgi:TonB family protein